MIRTFYSYYETTTLIKLIERHLFLINRNVTDLEKKSKNGWIWKSNLTFDIEWGQNESLLHTLIF